MSRLRNLIYRASSRIPANLALRLDNAPLCTFTFDDCPRTALDNGGRILEEHGVAGTYFVTSEWLADSAGSHAHMLGPADLADLVRRGHELGCHTYSHMSLLDTPLQRLRADLDRNRETLLRESAAESLVSFSYPFGEARWAAKCEISNRFAVARGVRPGINGRIVDLAQLLAIRISAHNFSVRKIEDFVQRAAERRGWIIFYTHDVKHNPAEGSCTEEQFSQTVELVIRAGIEIIPMRSAVGRIMHRQSATSGVRA